MSKRAPLANRVLIMSGPSASPDHFAWANAPKTIKIAIPRTLDFATYRKVDTVIIDGVPVSRYDHVPAEPVTPAA